MEIQKPKFSYLDHLRWLNSYETGLDKPIMHSPESDPPPKYKVRKTWFTGVSFDLDGLIEEGKITDVELIGEIYKFLYFLSSPEFSGDKPTTHEEIRMADSLIEKVLKSL